jgi:hypothetical protein
MYNFLVNAINKNNNIICIRLINNIFSETLKLIYIDTMFLPPPYNNLKQIIPLHSIKQLWNLFGKQKRLKHDKIKSLSLYCNSIKSLENEFKYIFDEIRNNINLPNQTEDDLFYKLKYYYNLLNEKFILISNQTNNLFIFIKSIEDEKLDIIDSILLDNSFYCNSVVDYFQPINEKNSEWLFSLVNIYKKYKGVLPVKSNDFLFKLKELYPNLEIEEQIEVVNIIDHILGGLNTKDLNNISKNLEDWLKRNYNSLNQELLNTFTI